MNKTYYTLILSFCFGIIKSQVDVNDVNISFDPDNPIPQCEHSVFIDPTNPNKIAVANNLIGQLGITVYLSNDGGMNWQNIVSSIRLNDSYFDPSMIINNNGRIMVNYMSEQTPGHSGNNSISFTDDDGLNWTQVIIDNFHANDKNHLWIDSKKWLSNNTTNFFYNRLYCGWTDLFSYTLPSQIMVSYSNNNGYNWTPPIYLSQGGAGNIGANIQTGINGEVYICWTKIISFLPNPQYEIWFAKSLDGGNTFNLPVLLGTSYGINLGGGKVFSQQKPFPSMTVNLQNGNIYVVYPTHVQQGNTDIVILKSTDNGNSWASINHSLNDNTDQWLPWMAYDKITNSILIEYLTSENFANNDSIHTYVAISYDDGLSWNKYKISDVPWTWTLYHAPIAGGYDYLGISCLDGKCIPIWSDDRAGTMSTYTNPFNIPCPQDLSLIYGNYFITDEVSFDDDASYSAINNIYVAGQTIHNSTYKIYPNASVYMSAGNDIIIDDGFESEGEFIAEISPCNYFCGKLSNNNSNRTLSLHTPDKEILIYTNNTNDLKNKKDESVLIAPNPASTSIIIQTSNSANTIQHIAIKDITGKTVAQQTVLPQPSTTLDISYLSNGLYFIEVQTNKGTFTEKIVVQR